MTAKQTVEAKSKSKQEIGCCPRIDESKWEGAEHIWNKKLFVKDVVRSAFYIPVNFSKVLERLNQKVEQAQAQTEESIWLTDHNSPWTSDLLVSITKEVPGCSMKALSGTFFSKVFIGSYRDMKRWMQEMETFVSQKKREIGKMYFWYTTCPKCAKKYGKNVVVVFAKVK